MKTNLIGLLLTLILLGGCSSTIVDCNELFGNRIHGAEVVYEQDGMYVISGGTYTIYTGVSTDREGYSDGVQNYSMVAIGTGIAGENVSRKNECLVKEPSKKRRRSMIENYQTNGL